MNYLINETKPNVWMIITPAFGMNWVQILGRRPEILTEDFSLLPE
jgi:hypothetical protein